MVLKKYKLPNATYCIYYVTGESNYGSPTEDPATSIEVFRLSPVPRGYQPKTKRGQQILSDTKPGVTSEDAPEFAYRADLLAVVSGQHKAPPVYDYELIYSDPPASKSVKTHDP